MTSSDPSATMVIEQPAAEEPAGSPDPNQTAVIDPSKYTD